MKESVVTFGQGGRLVGILTEPAIKPHDLNSNPTLVFLNAGLLHRVGPFRMSVDFSRELSELGYLVFRFDLSGIGDSEKSREPLDDLSRANQDIVQAMDFISEKCGSNKFILLGLCSGADQAHRVGLIDPRVVGIVSIDGYGFRTAKFYLVHFAKRIFSIRRWRNFLSRKISKLFSGLAKPSLIRSVSRKVELFRRGFPGRDQAQAEVQQFVERGMKLLFVYTGGVPDYYNYNSQFFDMFPKVKSKKSLQVQFYPKSDHTFSLGYDRRQLLRRIALWLSNPEGEEK